MPDRGILPRDTEPMPEPPAESTDPTPSPFDNPFGQPRDAQPPAAAEVPQPAVDDMPPALDDEPPAPRATDSDNPFAPRPGPTETTPPTDTTPAPTVDNPFAPRPGANETTPPAETTPAPETDNPFAPRDSAPPPATDESNPFAPRSGAADSPAPMDPASTEPTTENVFAPSATESQPEADNPFAPPPANAASTPDDPFRLPTDAAEPPMSEVNEAPMDNAPPAPIDDAPPAPIIDSDEETTESVPSPALDNPFADPAADRLSHRRPAPEPADAMRLWTDITGKHQVRGQMKKILIAEQKVRILKDTGKYTTVPFARLSEADRTFVARHTIEPSSLLAETR
jgi:type VI secretion system secreted protein VgrG